MPMSLVSRLTRQQFMMDFELKLTKPSRKYSCLEGLVMGVAYFIGESHTLRSEFS